MRILDRYINKSIITIFISTVLIFCFLYILIDITATLDEIIELKIPADILIRYYLSFFPIILGQTSSIACLIAVLFTFSRLNNNNEVIAMRSAGMNFWQVTKPALFFGLIVSALVFFLNEKYVPQASQQKKQIKDENMILVNDRVKNMAEIKNLTFYGLRNRLYYVDTFSPKTNSVKGITIIEYDESQRLKEKVVAYEGQWTGIAWKFSKGNVTYYNQQDGSEETRPFDTKLMDIKETPVDFVRQRLNVEGMNIRELYEYIGRFSNSGAIKALNNLRVDFHQKIAYPIGNFVIVLVGLPFALLVKSRKGMTFTAIGLAMAIAFLFYVSNAVGLAFGKGGFLPPIIAAWITPVLFTSVGLLTIHRKFS